MKSHCGILRRCLGIPEEVSDLDLLVFAPHVREAALEISNERGFVVSVMEGVTRAQASRQDELSRRATYLARLDDHLRDVPAPLADAIRDAARRDHASHDELVAQLARLDEERKRLVAELGSRAPVVPRDTLDALHAHAGGLERRRQRLIPGGQGPKDPPVIPAQVLAKWREEAEAALAMRAKAPTFSAWDAETANQAREAGRQ
jgi:hypothetical protein